MANDHDKREKNDDRREIVLTLIRFTLSLIIALLGLFLFTESFGDEHLGVGNGVWLNLSVMLAAYLIAGYPIIIGSVKETIEERSPFNENVLMLVASIGAFSLRIFGAEHNEFFEAVMIVLLNQVGELFEEIGTERTHKAIRDAIGLKPKKATLIKDGAFLDVAPEDLHVGDSILVKVGEILPADGFVVEGEGSVDMSSLTGEFDPVSRRQGDFVNSGTLLTSGTLKIEVSKEYKDSTVSAIIRLIEESEEKKSKTDKFIARFAKIYTPIVMGLALAFALIPPLCLGGSGEAWSRWIYIGVSLLVISCPCALVVSVPLAFFAGAGLASKNGIVVKGLNNFDELSAMRLLVTDKTGTLTEGRFSCVQEKALSSDFKKHLIIAESRSNHPLALAIRGNAKAEEVKFESYDEKAGYGIIAQYEGKELLAGNAKLLRGKGVAFSESEELGSHVYVAYGGQYEGYARFIDAYRKQSKPLIEGLRQSGIETLMLTGDKNESAEEAARALGIARYEAELLPEEKKRILEQELAKKEGKIAFLGDGINDAPSIAMADIGFAMGGAGSDAAIASADVVIMNDDPSKVLVAYKIAKATRFRAIFNIIAALAVKAIVALLAFILPYTAGIDLPFWAAVFCDTGMTIALVISSVSLLFKKIR